MSPDKSCWSNFNWYNACLSIARDEFVLIFQLHPLLLESLNTDDAGLSQSTLEGIHTILQNPTSAALMSDSVPSLVPRLLTLATKPDSMV